MRELGKFLFLAALFLSAARIQAATVEVTEYAIFSGIPAADSQEALDTLIADANDSGLMKKMGNQDRLSSAAGLATAYSLSSSRFYTPGNFETFYFLFGANGAIYGNAEKLSSIGDDNPDPDAGGGGNFLLSAGYNADKIRGFPAKGFVFHCTFGINTSGYDGLGFESLLFGGGFDYKLYKPARKAGSFQPGPVFLSTGVNYSRNSIRYTYDKEYTTESKGVFYVLDQSSDLEIKSSVYSFPLELHSSAKLLWFMNLFAGAGCDIVLGNSTIDVDTTSQMSAYQSSDRDNAYDKSTAETIVLKNGNTETTPAVFIYHVTAGIGLEMNSLHLDFPFSYYPAKGFTAGATASVVF